MMEISPPSPRPPSSVYSNDLPIILDLIRQVLEKTIASYIREIHVLEEELALY